MKQITRDLYTSGRVWLSLSHSFTQSTDKDSEIELVKVSGDFVTLNAGALFILSLWSSGVKTPEKFYIPEYKIEEFKMILSTLRELKTDEGYVRDGELTEKGKASSLYYRLVLNNKKYIDVYFVENDYNGDKSINIAIEFNSKVYSLYDSNVVDLIDIIPTMGEIARYKQTAAELYYMETYLLGSSGGGSSTQSKPSTVKKSAPKTVTKVDRTNIHKNLEVENHSDNVIEEKSTVEYTEPVKQEEKPTSGFNYSSLLEDKE